MSMGVSSALTDFFLSWILLILATIFYELDRNNIITVEELRIIFYFLNFKFFCI